MKLKLKDKIKIIRFYEEGNSIPYLSKQFYYFKLVTTISYEEKNDTELKVLKKAFVYIRELSYKNQRLHDLIFYHIHMRKVELVLCHSVFYDKINNY